MHIEQRDIQKLHFHNFMEHLLESKLHKMDCENWVGMIIEDYQFEEIEEAVWNYFKTWNGKEYYTCYDLGGCCYDTLEAAVKAAKDK